MFRSKTVFVVGAGASAEVGLPIGRSLKTKIAGLLDIRFEFDGRHTGDPKIVDALRHYVAKENPQKPDINPYLHAAWTISDQMPTAQSIDHFIHAHAQDSKIALCGKLGIVRAILDAEQSSDLYSERGNEFNYRKIEPTWFAQFFKLLSEDVQKPDVRLIFQNVSFITFNYDRCIEQYLKAAITGYYRLSEQEAVEVMGTLKIYRPFGSVGALPWQDAKEGIPFGGDSYVERLLPTISRIKTFTEQAQEQQTVSRIHEELRYAHTLVFLGLAYHRLNLDLMTPKAVSIEAATSVERIFGTAVEISDNDCGQITEDLYELIGRKRQHVRIQLRNDCKCAKLFSEYWRTLAA